MPENNTVKPIAVNLHSLDALPGNIDDILSQVAKAGFSAVETIGDHGLDVQAFRDLVDTYRLQVVSSHIRFDALQDRLPDVIAFNQTVGNDTLVVPFIPKLREAQTAHVYQETGKLLGDLARSCRAEGMSLLYHNHHFEFVEFDGQPALDWLFHSAGPDLGFEPDLAWIAAAGVDPLNVLRCYSGRCPRVHVKDLAPAGERLQDAIVDDIVQADVGYGRLDWQQLLPAAAAAGTEWYIIEHDNPPDPIASVSRSLTYLQQNLPAVLPQSAQ